MASIEKRVGKTKTSYLITVTSGVDIDGKQIKHRKTWTPAPGMTKSQTEKELKRVVTAFESSIEQGFDVDNKQTFAEYAEYVINLKERTGTKRSTVELYRDLLKVINPAIGHLKLTDIRPQHLNTLYANLGEKGIRRGRERAKLKKDITALVKETGLTQTKFAEIAKTAPTNIRAAMRGDNVSRSTADAIAKALNKPTAELFKIIKDESPLSSRTILQYHRFISTVFTQAEKEMIVQYNPASKATPPKMERNEAECFQPEEVLRIIECLENEPIKWKTITHLLIITGCRRGEIAGLKWSAIDWENNQIKIERALLYSADIGVYEDTTKTGEIRYIKLPTDTMQLLRKYRAWHSEERLKNGDRWKDTGFLFTRDDGGMMNPDSITQWLAKFSDKYGLPHIHPHKFRHTMASMLYYNGFDSITISKRLGHSQVSTTTDIYSHVIKQADAMAADAIAETIFQKRA